MTTLTTDRSLMLSNPAVAIQLRLLQFEVADAGEQGELAAKIARRLMQEISALEYDDLRALMTHTSASKLLMAEFADIPPAERIAYALALRESEKRSVDLMEGAMPDPKSLLPAHFGDRVDTADVLFAMIVNHIDSSSAQLEAIRAFDAIPPEQRDGFLDAMSVIYEGDSVFVHSGWSRDQLGGGDMDNALRCYEEIGMIVSGWSRLEFKLEVVCARAIILDEEFKRFGDAIAVVDEAIESFGDQPVLLRQKSKILGHAGRFSEAVAALLPVEDTVSASSPFDRALALRDGASSAANAGLFADALRLIDGARKALSMSPAREALAIGFALEHALIKWRSGDRAGAIELNADSLEQVGRFAVDESMQALRSHKFARAMVGLFFSEVPGMPSEDPPPFSYGSASFLESETKAPPREELSPIGDNMRILAIVEAACRVDVGVGERSLEAQGGTTIPGIEFLLRQFRYANTVEGRNAFASLVSGLDATWALAVKQRYPLDQQNRVRIPSNDLILPGVQKFLSDPSLADRLKMVALDVVLLEKLQTDWTPGEPFWQELRTAARSVFGNDDGIGAVIDVAEGKTPTESNISMPMAHARVMAVTEEQVLGHPSVRFQRDVRLLQFVVQSAAFHAHLPSLATKFVKDWRFVIESQRFMLKMPRRLAPEVEMALSILETDPSGANVARLLSAVSPLVGQDLDASLDDALKRSSGVINAPA
ncbi:hypothetical protein [Rhizobium gallicum]|uniref:hypothetical protein n=1 Tax=Rhizobium gallicum TaxID=56730 RepID=UPI001EF9B5C2|nr:hypothetical protein [Rhizobium gallicum]ULJ73009.1 hypothetical protein L2W42_05025 [Rhizobium gallicum]